MKKQKKKQQQKKKQRKIPIKVAIERQKKISTKAAGRKVAVGNDEFCFNCMDWREYDDEGKCKVCRKQIKKKQVQSQKINYDEYRIEGVADEIDEEINETESEF